MATWITNNFDIDWWIKLAAEHPFKFEQQRHQWLENVIRRSRPEHRQRLKGLQWEMNMDLEIARHKFRDCKLISDRLVENLQRFKSIMEGKIPIFFNPKSATILNFVHPRD
jgi:hypothetical protein